MKRKVWGDVPSHPISDSGSDSRAASPEPAVNSPVDMSTPHEESPPQSPFQGHAQPDHDSQSDEDAPESQQTGLSSTSNKATNLASEPSLRHGLGEGKHSDPSLYSILLFGEPVPSLPEAKCDATFQNQCTRLVA